MCHPLWEENPDVASDSVLPKNYENGMRLLVEICETISTRSIFLGWQIKISSKLPMENERFQS